MSDGARQTDGRAAEEMRDNQEKMGRTWREKDGGEMEEGVKTDGLVEFIRSEEICGKYMMKT
jgi:hypothetical protein